MNFKKTIKYLLERKCLSGGFCFYRLDQPNAEDTYYALRTFKFLKIPFKDKTTRDFLRSIKDNNINTTYYKTLSLRMLGEPYTPTTKTLERLKNNLLRYGKLLDNYKLLKHTFRLLVLYNISHSEIPAELFSFADSLTAPFYLSDSYYLCKIKKILGKETFPFIAISTLCQDSKVGFTEAPSVNLSFLEQIYYGIRLCEITETPIMYPKACLKSVLSCIRSTGGFSRSNYGIATIKNTFYGVCCITKLEKVLLEDEKWWCQKLLAS